MNIELEHYNNAWPTLFEKEKDFLFHKIGHWLVGSIEHVGSTAVPGMVAKPVIDIMFGVRGLDASADAIGVLQDSGYCYYPYKPTVMHWFCKPTPEFRTHHLHLVPYKSPLWQDRINFRDILRSNSEIAEKYGHLKESLVKNLACDREAYTESKWPFIRKVLDGGISE